MDSKTLFEQYRKFVEGVTSEVSSNTDALMARLDELNEEFNVARMDTACAGIAGEAGEINDLWKKIKFHGKPWNEENKAKMAAEAGDMFWYLLHLCAVLDISFEDAILANIKKLEARYPGGTFSIERSENRTNEIV